MRYIAQLLVLAAPLAALAAPLQKEQVGADAKWLLHLDADKLRATKVGDFLVREHLAAALAQPKAFLKAGLGFDLDLNRISSITAYGTSYTPDPDLHAVLIIQTSLDLRKAMDATIQKTAASGDETPLKKSDEDGTAIYSVHDKIFVSFPKEGLVVVSGARGMLRREGDTLSGKRPNLTSTNTFSEYADAPKGFFFLGAAEGFSSDTTIPPQAQVLKMADGGRAVLGEDAERLFFNLAVKAKSAEVVSQMQQTIQGFIALASLSQPDNKDLQQLAQSVKVSAEGRVISFHVDFPVDQAIQHMRDVQEGVKSKHLEKSGREDDAESDGGGKKKNP